MTYANELAAQSQAARAAGHELMLHMPMEPLDLPRNDPGPNALLMKLDSAEIQRRLDWDLARFDGYVGVNNHMGSRFTRDKDRMAEVMAALRKRQVFWLDSLRSEEHTSELQSLMRISYAVFCLTKKSNDYN